MDLSCTYLVEWWDKFLKSFDLETSSMTASILWVLWNSINSLVWDGKHATVDEVLYSAMSIFIQWKGFKLAKADACHSLVVHHNI